MLVECRDACAQVSIVVFEDLVAPPPADFGFMIAQTAPPLEGRAPVMDAGGVHLDDLPVRVDRLHDLLDAWVQAARKDHVGHPVYVFEILLVARDTISHDVLQAEPRTGRGPLVNGAEKLAQVVDRLAETRLLGRNEVIDHANRLDRVVFDLRAMVLVVAAIRLDAGNAAAVDLFHLGARERHAVGALHTARGRQVFEVGAPTATDVEDFGFGCDVGEIRQDPKLVELRGLQRLLVVFEDRARVIHPLVEPEAEEIVGDVVRDLNFVFGGSHVISRSPSPTREFPPGGVRAFLCDELCRSTSWAALRAAKSELRRPTAPFARARQKRSLCARRLRQTAIWSPRPRPPTVRYSSAAPRRAER